MMNIYQYFEQVYKNQTLRIVL